MELRGTGVLFLFVDCGALPRQQLLLLYPLLWSNPSLSCTVCLWDRYHSHSGDEAAGCGGSATSLVMDLFSTKGCSRFYLLPKKRCRGSSSLSVFIRKVIKVWCTFCIGDRFIFQTYIYFPRYLWRDGCGWWTTQQEHLKTIVKLYVTSRWLNTFLKQVHSLNSMSI